jgi:aryl-alcohol dehydrogenase-like predicted oxidoreductase
MERRRLGQSDLDASVVGLGCNNFGMRCDEEATRAVVHRALDLGINFFDTADVYGGRGVSEQLLGRALGARRSEVLIATKFAGPMGEGLAGASAAYVVKAAEASLKRLGTDVIDLYQIHFPDASTPIEETLGALDGLVTSGKVRQIGCSNFTGWQLVEAQWTSRTASLAAFCTAQNQYSLLDRRIERELIPAAKKYGVGILPYFPLASGLLSGKYHKGEPAPSGSRLSLMGPRAGRFLNDDNLDRVEKLRAFAAERGRSLLDLAIGWLVSNPAVPSVIAGATKPEQLDQNVQAATWRLTDEDRTAVDELLKDRG